MPDPCAVALLDGPGRGHHVGYLPPDTEPPREWVYTTWLPTQNRFIAWVYLPHHYDTRHNTLWYHWSGYVDTPDPRLEQHMDQPNRDYIFVDCTDEWGFNIGLQLLYVHHPHLCAGTPCCIHNPTNHHMTTWPQLWRADRRIMERICPHGCGHPDPDDRATVRDHGCCGCCTTPT